MDKGKLHELTLLKSISSIVVLAVNSGLNEEFFDKANPYICYLAERQGITKMQAVLLSLFIEICTTGSSADFSDLARFLNCKNVEVLQYMDAVNELVKMGMLREKTDEKRGESCYCMPLSLLSGFAKNETYKPKSYINATGIEFFQHVYSITHLRYTNQLSTEILVDEVLRVIDENPQLHFVKSLREIGLPRLNEVVLTHMCRHLIIDGTENVPMNHLSFLFDSFNSKSFFEHALVSGNHCLIREGWIENASADGFRDSECYRLTEKSRELLLSEFNLQIKGDNKYSFIHQEDIIPKSLFFNEQVEQQLNCLSELLNENNYSGICNRLKAKGHRQGFACLFYGAPGTGKTESVLQLAHKTGRDIMQVDISRIKSMWVGQSEKNIKALFDYYRNITKRSKSVPILLFNEADGVIGKRKQNVEQSIDKMENSIQNIILQEMESLDGIMIATTNLVQNIDSAFERRFLYKVKFDRPGFDQRTKIWHSMLPSLTDESLHNLASCYDFSGGQIENIARKCDIQTILYGEHTVNDEAILQFCKEEGIASEKGRKIGFSLS